MRSSDRGGRGPLPRQADPNSKNAFSKPPAGSGPGAARRPSPCAESPTRPAPLLPPYTSVTTTATIFSAPSALHTRVELFANLSRTRTLTQACERYLQFAMDHPHAYEVLFDGFAQPPSLHEPWPSFNLMRQRLSERLGGTPRQHTRLMLSVWSLMHGTAMLLIRGGCAAGPLRTQMFHSCMDSVEAIIAQAARSKGKSSGPKWPANLILGEAAHSKVTVSRPDSRAKSTARLPASRVKA